MNDTPGDAVACGSYWTAATRRPIRASAGSLRPNADGLAPTWWHGPQAIFLQDLATAIPTTVGRSSVRSTGFHHGRAAHSVVSGTVPLNGRNVSGSSPRLWSRLYAVDRKVGIINLSFSTTKQPDRMGDPAQHAAVLHGGPGGVATCGRLQR
jgi:hypothetical protein